MLTNGFRDHFKRADHFRKHPEVHAINEFEYERKADQFLAGPKGLSVRECVRPDGDIVRYDAATGEFGCLAPDRYIRTYKIFNNVNQGMAYYRRQCVRRFP